jgi:hypothetical protein
LGKGVERNVDGEELGFAASSRFTATALVVEIDLVERFLNTGEEEEGLYLVDLGGTEEEEVLVQSENGVLRVSFRFRSYSIVRFWNELGSF